MPCLTKAGTLTGRILPAWTARLSRSGWTGIVKRDGEDKPTDGEISLFFAPLLYKRTEKSYDKTENTVTFLLYNFI